ncbi:MAG TPA: Crp/Fnr family transcriptional regulator [Rhodopila sp.]|nr:Crp/Fnr family transcriptional regulator [Rhodopila sp.]
MADEHRSQNSLLAALPDNDWRAIRPDLKEVPLSYGEVLIRADKPFSRIYFLLTGVISSVALFQDGRSAEMATTGAEGMVDIGAVLGSDTSLSQYVVQVPGNALVAHVDTFRQWQAERPAFRRVLLDYAQAFLFQILQSVACNAVHPIQDRAARWLLTCDDRMGNHPLTLTQQLMAEMLGVTRPTVNTVARTFQRAGLIRYHRGLITILDRDGLAAASCECYGTIRRAYEQRNIRLGPPRGP